MLNGPDAAGPWRKAMMMMMQTPAWFEDAKLGVIIHWGPYTIPAFAPIERSLPELLSGVEREPLAYIPYAEWYWNSIRCTGSPAHRFHLRTYGAQHDYVPFGREFREASRDFAVETWASLFAETSVRYAVLTTKHSDGFLLWPSAHKNPRVADWFSERDLVGDVATAMRARGIRFGAYYCGGYDWAFTSLPPIRTASETYTYTPSSPDYTAYMLAHFDELIERYRPDVVWNDMSFPAPAAEKEAMFARYLAAVPEGAVNDRFEDMRWGTRAFASPLVRRLLDAALPRLLPLAGVLERRLDPRGRFRKPAHFRCYEFTVPPDLEPKYWETTRGLGYSFGYNRLERDDMLLTDAELLHMLLDVIAKNGNLMLGIAVHADGKVVPSHERALRALGRWLATYGEAVFATRACERAAGTALTGEPLRFTRRGETTFVHVLHALVPGARIDLADAPGARRVRLVGHGPVASRRDGSRLAIELPPSAPATPHAYALALEP